MVTTETSLASGYGGETTLSHFVQMAGLTVQNFVSAATGIAVLLVFIKGFPESELSSVFELNCELFSYFVSRYLPKFSKIPPIVV